MTYLPPVSRMLDQGDDVLLVLDGALDTYTLRLSCPLLRSIIHTFSPSPPFVINA